MGASRGANDNARRARLWAGAVGAAARFLPAERARSPVETVPVGPSVRWGAASGAPRAPDRRGGLRRGGLRRGGLRRGGLRRGGLRRGGLRRGGLRRGGLRRGVSLHGRPRR